MSKKIAILGSGANGTAIGVDLIRAGLDVTLIDQWPAHVEALRANGARIELPDETIEQAVDAYHLCDVATFTEPFDIVLMLFKAYDTPWTARLIEPCLAEDGILVGVQNGMSYAAIAEAVGAERAMACVIEVASELHEPGIIKRSSPRDGGSWFAIGSAHPATAGREPEIAEVLGHAGVVEISDDILAAKWMKLVSNAMTLATTALVGLPIDEAVELPGMRDLMLKAGAEALAAGEFRGHPITPIFGLKPEDMQNTNQLLELLHDKLMSFTRPNTLTTVLMDHLKGRQSETGDVNGAVVETLAGRANAAPANTAIVEITERIRRGELLPNPGNLDLIREMVAT
jgi:2-dehydropantoate 2-reductase